MKSENGIPLRWNFASPPGRLGKRVHVGLAQYGLSGGFDNGSQATRNE